MGFNFRDCGDPSIDDFVAAMSAGERGQLDAFVGYCRKKAGMVAALKANNFVAMATLYMRSAITTRKSQGRTRSTGTPSMGDARVCLAAWLFAAFLSGSAIGADAEPRLHSGIFEGMMLAVDLHGAVTGYYRQDQGEGAKALRLLVEASPAVKPRSSPGATAGTRVRLCRGRTVSSCVSNRGANMAAAGWSCCQISSGLILESHPRRRGTKSGRLPSRARISFGTGRGQQETQLPRCGRRGRRIDRLRRLAGG